MRVTFVIASSPQEISMPRLGIAYLTSCLRGRGHQVNVLDFNIGMDYEKKIAARLSEDERVKLSDDNPEIFIKFLFPEYLEEKDLFLRSFYESLKIYIKSQAKEILRTEPDIIGFSVQKDNALFSLLLAQEIKKHNNNTLVIFGGPDTSQVRNGNFFIRTGFVDIVVTGEGEITLLEITDQLAEKKKITYCPGTLINLINYSGKIIDCEKRPLIKNLDDIPFPDFDGLPLQRYRPWNVLPIIISRGCVGNCIFCDEKNFWQYYRYRSIKNIIQEIQYQKEKHGIYKFYFCDSLINGNIKLLTDLCDNLIKQKIEIYWGGNARISPAMTPKLLKKMFRAGCRFLRYGLESGSQSVLDAMRKAIKVKDAHQVLRNTHKVGIWVYVYLITGFPTETEADFIQTLKFIYENRNNINTFHAQSFTLGRGSPFYQELDKFGIKIFSKFKKFPKKIEDCFKYFDYYLHEWYSKDDANYENSLKKRKQRNKIFYSIFRHKTRLEELLQMFDKGYKMQREDLIQVNLDNLKNFLKI